MTKHFDCSRFYTAFAGLLLLLGGCLAGSDTRDYGHAVHSDDGAAIAVIHNRTPVRCNPGGCPETGPTTERIKIYEGLDDNNPETVYRNEGDTLEWHDSFRFMRSRGYISLRKWNEERTELNPTLFWLEDRTFQHIPSRVSGHILPSPSGHVLALYIKESGQCAEPRLSSVRTGSLGDQCWRLQFYRLQPLEPISQVFQIETGDGAEERGATNGWKVRWDASGELFWMLALDRNEPQRGIRITPSGQAEIEESQGALPSCPEPATSSSPYGRDGTKVQLDTGIMGGSGQLRQLDASPCDA